MTLVSFVDSERDRKVRQRENGGRRATKSDRPGVEPATAAGGLSLYMSCLLKSLSYPVPDDDDTFL